MKFRNEIISNREYVGCEFYNCNFIDVEINNCTMNNFIFKFSTMKNAILHESEFISIN
ncbi:pentapeptide repeat-containing protein [Romboutsia hominis]|uniref:Pentapeptide repeat-containing protein n=1 Tax=Romboutsia faecis TaxID=2764597 RepID=A0ABR7JTI4_9FIRM|nr:pentapeptide repeat-containing protein [Romboutsia faecis]